MNTVSSFLDEYGFSQVESIPVDSDAIDGGADARQGGGAPGDRFLVKEVTTSLKQSSAYRKKRQYLVEQSVEALIDKYGVEPCAFITLTLENEQLEDGSMGYPSAREIMKRLRSLASNVLSKEFLHWIRVYEEGDHTGRPHFHFFVVTRHKDIRNGFDFETFAFAKASRSVAERRRLTKIYSASACPELKAEWPKWRKIAKAYGFGRTEFAPVKSAKNAGAYIGDYLGKDFGLKGGSLKGLRVLGASKGALIGNVHFSFAINYKKDDKGNKVSTGFSPGAWLWRRKMEVTARRLGINEFAMFKVKFGPKWAYALQDSISSVDLVKEHGGQFTYPSARVALLDGHEVPSDMDCKGPLTVTYHKVRELPDMTPEMGSDNGCPSDDSRPASELPVDLWIDMVDQQILSREKWSRYVKEMPPAYYEPRMIKHEGWHERSIKDD